MNIKTDQSFVSKIHITREDLRLTADAFIANFNGGYKLPEGLTKASAIRITIEALNNLDVSRTTIEAFRLIADATERVAWFSESKIAINWQKQKHLATKLRTGTRHFRRIERELEQLGLVARKTAENGWRGKSRRGERTYGLSVEAAIKNIHLFIKINEQAEQAMVIKNTLIGEIKSFRRQVRSLMSYNLIKTDSLLAEASELIGRSIPYTQKLEIIQKEHTFLKNLVEKYTGIQNKKAKNTTQSESQKWFKMSGEADINVRCHKNLLLNQVKEKEDSNEVIENYKEVHKLSRTYILRLAKINNPLDCQGLVELIERTKVGTEAENLDYSLIWKRFCECNARNDRNAVPIAALHGFIINFRDHKFKRVRNAKKIKRNTPVIKLTVEEKNVIDARNIKSGKDYLCRNINYSAAMNLIRNNLVSEDECRAVGL